MVDRSPLLWRSLNPTAGLCAFRDEEVNQDNVRVLPNGETVSVDGTHLGHNLPDMNLQVIGIA